ncbi:MAG: energy-coupling factor transporter ATPase [Thaumarchaeota archaeon]|nr:energy-coupling factor transporter ATPase [Candidatus Calditenuaceae archaeon]MDW8042132.1 energy-coupling factor transporter ATPase [Nitrososphaerota archaeon]
MTKAVEVRDVWVKYRGSADYALKGVSLEVSEGEVVAIVGPTGAGKTTLCKVMTGLIPNMGVYDDFKGEVRVYGESTYSKRVGDISKSCAMVMQDYETQLFRTTVELEVAFGPENLLLDREEIRRRVQWALKLVGLSGLEKRYSFSLSGGQKQRLAIASLLSLQPSVLILDEATSDLDPRGKREVYDVMRKLIDEEVIKSLVFVDHHLDKVAEFADRLVTVVDGRILVEGEARDVLGRVEELRSLGLKPPEVAEICWDLGVRANSVPVLLDEALRVFPKVRSVRMPERRIIRGERVAAELSDLWFAYEGQNWVLKGVNLRVHEGEMLALIGQNGSGKTTLAQVLMGILKPNHGKVWIFGRDATPEDVSERARDVGYIFQNPDYQIFSQTVYEELAYGLRARGLSEADVERKVKEVADMTGISHLLNEDPFFLQKGERQRVAVASILALNPRIIILDEPTTGLSPGETRALMNTVLNLNRGGTTVITITHEMWVVAEYCTRTVMMADGRVVLDAPTREAFSSRETLIAHDIFPPETCELSRRVAGLTLLTPKEFVEHVEVV